MFGSSTTKKNNKASTLAPGLFKEEINVQNVTVAETGCGKDVLFNQRC